MNSFARYGIEHLSPSACNLFVSSPAMFVLEKVLKRRQPVGCAAHRGTAVEAGVIHGLMNGVTEKECAEVAARKFQQLTALSGDPRKEKEQTGLAGMVTMALGELAPYGAPTSTQGKISHSVDGLSVPLIGFYDMEWADKGVLVDLKTTHALPSQISTNHARQVALYGAARGGNHDIRITYATPKKVATYRVDNPREHVLALERIALTIQRFLSITNDPQELVGIVAPDVDHYFFADPLARQAAFETWSL
jgi:hypothetical protein